MSDVGAFDWCSFFALFWNDKGFKCKINIPDTVLFRYGQLSAWWATNKEGYVQRHASHNTSLEAIRRRFIQVAECDEANYSKYVSVVRSGDGQPQLLRLQAFNQLTELLSDRIEAGHTSIAPDVETPQVLQAFVQPHNDLRYITTYIGGGANNITCHTFQRKYSRRYVAQGAPLPPGAADGFAADASLAFGSSLAAQDETPDPVTGQGAVDPTLKMEFRKLTSHLVKYIEKAHHLTLAGIVVEWIRDVNGKIYLLSVLRTEWATNASGHGAGSLAAANLTEEPREMQDPSEGVRARAADTLLASIPGAGELPNPPAPPPLSDGWSHTLPENQQQYQLPYQQRQPSPAWAGSPAGGATSPPVYAPPPPGVTLPSPNRTTILTHNLPGGGSRPGSAYPGSAAGAYSSPASPAAGEYGVRPPGVPGMGAGTTMSSLAAYPGGGRSAGMTVTVGNTWPSHQHEAALGSPTGRAVYAGAGAAAGPTSPSGGSLSGRPISSSLSATQLPSFNPYAAASNGQHHSFSVSSGAGVPGGMASTYPVPGTAGRIQSARPAPASPALGGGAPAVVERSSAGPRPPRPGSSPVAFGRNASTSPLRTSTLNPSPVPGVIPHTGMIPERSPSPSPSPGVAGPRTASPVRSRPGTASSPNPGTGHVNAGSRGAPLMMQQLTRDLESTRDQLLAQNQLAEASAAKVRQLEREKELLVAAYDQRTAELHSSLLVARQDLAAARAEVDELRKRAHEAEARVTELEHRNAALQHTLDGERGTVMTALRECHERDATGKERTDQLEEEVLRLTERLKEESTTVAALKRQLLQFSDIAERYATTHREGDMEPGMQEVLDRVQKLFVGQTNPFGESYSVQKVLHHYHGDLRAVFLFYAQLENNFAAYWPPGMPFQQWMLFCKETETSDPRATSRVSSVTQLHKMLHPRDCEAVFKAYAKMDPNAINTSAPVLSYEGFLSALIDVAFRVKRIDQPYLSEAVREYVLTYVSRACKMSPTGLRRGQMRDALEGTKDGPLPTPGGGVASKSATKGKKKATIAVSTGWKEVEKVIKTTTGTSAGGSLAASRPNSALSRKASHLQGAIEQDLAVVLSSGRVH
ncbi:hypothetical protein HYH02_014302 [Chlamydomonas schloesseri]|uniref:Uncharacterized protein n=1 Tax=Chlamydomonas schloesseri TaxID=2026947 RepID=A0A835SY25_9CHLO|nr:hypothetical protein HYH02_014302 [Chlamydomonas schloesseri]|eukprot:KAG2428600.1 hypothetical protein HYH02_014302 [Chlamydomonas schloesseri]